jgi:amino acid transporter
MAGAIWLSYGKVLLSIGLVVFTLGDMAGGNLMHDRFGFRQHQENCFGAWVLSGW